MEEGGDERRRRARAALDVRRDESLDVTRDTPRRVREGEVKMSSLAEGPAPAAPGVLDDVSNLIDLDLLQSELDSARGQVDVWLGQRELSMKEAVLEHKKRMVKAEELKMELKEKEEKFLVQARELQRRRAQEQSDLDALQEEANQLRELGKGLPEELQISREHVHSERMELERETAALAGEELVKAQVLKAHQSAVDLYRARLGLRFETGEDGEFKFFFKFVDPADHNREFMVAVRVKDAGGYELVDCDPEVGEIESLMEECNRTDNLSAFVRGVRKAFRLMVAAEEVAAAAKALRLESTQSTVQAEEPGPVVPETGDILSLGETLEVLPLQ